MNILPTSDKKWVILYKRNEPSKQIKCCEGVRSKRGITMQEKLVMLIADDVEVNRASLKVMFEQEYEVLEAENGAEALDILTEKEVDVVILDVFMPVMDGEAVLGRMKADSRLRDIPVIVKTTIDENMEVTMLEKGADDFIFSPCEPAIIINRVRNIVQKYVMRQMMLQKKIQEERHANRVKGAFIERISKEIREDTQKILGLCSSKVTCEEASSCETLEQISEQAEHLLTVVENVLDVSWVGEEAFVAHAVPFQLQDVVSEVMREYCTLFQKKGISFELETANVVCESLMGDCGHLRQIWGRMLKKAYKNTSAGEKIRTSYRQRRVGKGQVELEITVHGNLGANDGYPVTKSIVELLHGSMTVMDQKGEGVGAIITLPFRIGKEPVAQKTSFAGMKAIVLDDNEYFRNYHTAIFSRLGIDCDIAANGAEAAQLLENAYAKGRGYDICFANWYMLGGEDIIREIRTMYTSEQMIITCSTNEKERIESSMKAAGVDYVMERPVYQATLYQVLRDICKIED